MRSQEQMHEMYDAVKQRAQEAYKRLDELETLFGQGRITYMTLAQAQERWAVCYAQKMTLLWALGDD